MLILSRREAESICLGDDVVLTVVSVGNDKVRIGVQAPAGIRILRHELEVTKPSQSAMPGLNSVGATASSGLQVATPHASAMVTVASGESSPLLLPCPPRILPVSGPLGHHLRKAVKRRAA